MNRLTRALSKTLTPGLLCAALIAPTFATAQGFGDGFDVDFEAEDAGGMPDHDLDADVYAIVDEILNRSADAKDTIYRRFGEEFVAELLRVLAGWRDEDANRAYGKLLEWNMEFFFELDEGTQERFVDTVVARSGAGSSRLRGDLALEILGAVGDSAADQARMLGAGYLTRLLGGAEGARMILYLEARGLHDRVQPLLAHVLLWDWEGKQAVGEALGQVAHQVALRVKGGDFFADEAVAEAQARLLGRAIAHVEAAVDDWAAEQDEGPQASAAHGAAIVRFALGAIDTATGGVSSVVTGPIRKGVDWLEEYETSREAPPPDPAKELRKQMLSAVIVPFHKLVTDDVSLEEEEMQVLVESFRRNVEGGRNSTWGG
jgi:hypothetical protein